MPVGSELATMMKKKAKALNSGKRVTNEMAFFVTTSQTTAGRPIAMPRGKATNVYRMVFFILSMLKSFVATVHTFSKSIFLAPDQFQVNILQGWADLGDELDSAACSANRIDDVWVFLLRIAYGDDEFAINYLDVPWPSFFHCPNNRIVDVFELDYGFSSPQRLPQAFG